MKENIKIWSEKVLERKLVEGVKKLGGKALKFYSKIDTSYPDRLIQMPGGKTYWVEVKSTGKEQTPLQQLRAKELTQLGFRVFVVDTQEKLDVLLWSLGDKQTILQDDNGTFMGYGARLVRLNTTLFKA